MQTEKEYQEKGYSSKLSPYPEKKDALYLRPNKIYDIGNALTSSIIIGNCFLCHLVCDKEGNVILKQSSEAKGLIKINNKIITAEKVLLKHEDIIEFESVKFQFEMYFSNGIVKLNCKKLHSYLIQKYPEFTTELQQLENKTASILLYRKGLKEQFDKLDKINKERVERFRDILRDVIEIILDDNPTARFQLKNAALQKEIQQRTVSVTIDTGKSFSMPSLSNKSLQSISTIKPNGKSNSISTQIQPVINNQKEKSVMFSNTLSCVLNFDTTMNEETFEEFRKRHLEKSSNPTEHQSKRSFPQ